MPDFEKFFHVYYAKHDTNELFAFIYVSTAEIGIVLINTHSLYICFAVNIYVRITSPVSVMAPLYRWN